jgi:hypothetical protein
MLKRVEDKLSGFAPMKYAAIEEETSKSNSSPNISSIGQIPYATH